MPHGVAVMVYQPKGKGHVKYLNRMAMRIWKDTYQCRDDGDGKYWQQSIKDAMTLHRNYLQTGFKARPMKSSEYSTTPPKDKGNYWKEPQSGLWMPMNLN